jgi:hypothetical protein
VVVVIAIAAATHLASKQGQPLQQSIELPADCKPTCIRSRTTLRCSVEPWHRNYNRLKPLRGTLKPECKVFTIDL